MNRSASAKLWLTAAEVADLFGVTARTVSRWIDDGAMPGFRLPGPRGSRRVLRIKLIHFIQQRPEFHFALEILDGRPISTEGRETEQGSQDRSEEAAAAAGEPADGAAAYY